MNDWIGLLDIHGIAFSLSARAAGFSFFWRIDWFERLGLFLFYLVMN